MQFLTDSFIAKYDKQPAHMNELGAFVYHRTYSRYLEEEKRREYYRETVRRSVEYNVKLAYRHLKKLGYKPPVKQLRKEAQELFDSMFNLEQFLSGRTMWIGGAENGVAEKFPLANFNCSFTTVRRWEDLSEIFYLLLVGTGAGFKNTLKMAKELPPIRNNVTLLHSDYSPLPKDQRIEHTESKELSNGFIKIYVGDSKEGWVEALRLFIDILTKPEYEHIHTIKINYNSIRPKGERLVTFGGHASGHEPMREMFESFVKVIKQEIDDSLEPWEIVDAAKGYVRVRPIAILDMGNLIGNNVVIGGVRRTAEIFLFDPSDIEVMFAKFGINGLWGQKAFEQLEEIRQLLIDNEIPVPKFFDKLAKKQYVVFYGKERKYFDSKDEADLFAETVKDESPFIDYPVNEGRKLDHRRMSNNSVAFTEKPTKKYLDLVFSMMRMEGEPGFVNLRELAIRRFNGMGITNPTEQEMQDMMELIGMNPCAEIDLLEKGVCNLTTINVMQFVIEQNGRFAIDMDRLIEAQKRSARAGLRMTLVELELSQEWADRQNIDRLTGCSLTGWKDAISKCGFDDEAEEAVLEILRDAARQESDEYAKFLRVVSPLLVTTVKPEGTLSQVAGGVSSGLHYSHSPYYVRRVRISAVDPLAKAVRFLGWGVNPEVGTPGETYAERIANAKTLVIDFPVESGATRTKDDVSIEEQLETYFRFQRAYTEHNASNTLHCREHEWQIAEDIIYDRWEEFTAVSFLSYDNHSYELAPYQEITKELYEEMKASMSAFDPYVLQYFDEGNDLEIDDSDCDGGVCPVR